MSLSHLAWAFRDITQSAWWQSWCLATAIDLSLVLGELAGVGGFELWVVFRFREGEQMRVIFDREPERELPSLFAPAESPGQDWMRAAHERALSQGPTIAPRVDQKFMILTTSMSGLSFDAPEAASRGVQVLRPPRVL